MISHENAFSFFTTGKQCIFLVLCIFIIMGTHILNQYFTLARLCKIYYVILTEPTYDLDSENMKDILNNN